jgi:hypothetical protein
MKYKCLKDFWMHEESEENGDVPAFKAGDVYEFSVNKVGDFYTSCNNYRSSHYMYKGDEFDEYFELVEE